MAQAVRKLLPYEPSVADTLGWISFKRGDYAEAFTVLKESVAKPAGAENPEIQYHFGKASYMMAEESLAKTALSFAFEKSKENKFDWREDCRQALAVLAINPQAADAAMQTNLEKQLSSRTMDPMVLTRLAAIYLQNGESEKALQAYKKLLAMIPSSLPTKMSLARLYQQKDVAKAYEMAKEVYKAAPYNPEAQRLLGQMAYAAKDYKLAASVLSEAVKKSTANPQIYFELAQADFAVGKITETMAALSQALSLNPEASLAADLKKMFDCVQALGASGATMDAAQLGGLLASAPNYLPALAVQAAQAEHSGAATLAINLNEKILGQFPNFVPAQKALAILYAANLDKIERAAELANAAREFYPDDLSLAKASGMISFAKEDYQRAASIMKKCVQRLSNDSEVFYYLGAAQFQLKDYLNSKSNLERALTLKLSGKNADAARRLLAGMK